MQEGNREVKGSTFIAPNLVKKTERLDRFGNVIDPRTKQIIKPVDKVE